MIRVFVKSIPCVGSFIWFHRIIRECASKEIYIFDFDFDFEYKLDIILLRTRVYMFELVDSTIKLIEYYLF